MADIKRLNYFTSQFLVEKDFDDEQAYHLTSRRRHNQTLHTSGVAEGLDVTLVGGRQVQVSAGSAIDRNGLEIVLLDRVTYTLTSGASGQDVFLSISYHEVLDPADADTQGLGQFTRTTERPVLQDATTAPAASDSAVLLARIHLSSATQIGTIDTTVRTLASAKVAPQAIATAQLADGAVTLDKLAAEARPSSVIGTPPITVKTDTVAKLITVGETHSARTDNPHATTAAQIDNQGGANQLVARINAGTGVIARARVESAITSGVVTFQQVPFSSNEVFSDEIDAGFGPGPLNVQFALEDVPQAGSELSADLTYVRTVMVRSVVDRATGRFRIFAARIASGTGTEVVKIRWFASKPTVGPDASVAISVSVSPPTATVISKATQDFKAVVNNTNNGNVTWKLEEGAAGGTLSNVTSTSVTYAPPGVSGKYHLTARSALDTSKFMTVEITVNADVTVLLGQPDTVTVFQGSTFALSANVINTDSKGVTWKIQEGSPTGGALSSTTASNITYTAPFAPGVYHVTATSAATPAAFATCTINVPAITIGLNQPSTVTVLQGASLALTAIVANTDNRGVTWRIEEGSSGFGTLSTITGASTTYTPPSVPRTYHVTAISAADQTKQATCAVVVPEIGISITPDDSTVHAGGSTIIRATITGTTNPNAIWHSGSAAAFVNPAIGPTTTWTAPGVGATIRPFANPQADQTKQATTTIFVPNIKTTETGGGGKFAPVIEQSPVSAGASAGSPARPSSPDAAPPASADEETDTAPKARAFVRPSKRSTTKLPPEPSDG